MEGEDLHQENQFYQCLSAYMKAIDNKPDSDDELVHNLYEQLLKIMERTPEPSKDIIRAFSHIFSEYPSRKRVLLRLMCSVVFTAEHITGSYKYPEFFWVLLQSGFFSETDIVTDTMSALTDVCGHDVLRSYLTYALLTEDKANQAKIVRAFYYVGHTMDSLKLTIDAVPLEPDNENIYNFIYSHAMSLLYAERASLLQQEDLAYLKTFFERGLQLSLPQIKDSCTKGLVKLNEISSQL